MIKQLSGQMQSQHEYEIRLTHNNNNNNNNNNNTFLKHEIVIIFIISCFKN